VFGEYCLPIIKVIKVMGYDDLVWMEVYGRLFVLFDSLVWWS